MSDFLHHWTHFSIRFSRYGTNFHFPTLRGSPIHCVMSGYPYEGGRYRHTLPLLFYASHSSFTIWFSQQILRSISCMPGFVPRRKQIMGVARVDVILGDGIHSTLAARLLRRGRECRWAWPLSGEVCSHSGLPLGNRTPVRNFSEMALTPGTQWHLKRTGATFLHIQHNSPNSGKCLTRLRPEKILEYSIIHDKIK